MHVDHLAFERDACASNLLHSVLVFLPSDAVLAQHLLSSCVCTSFCLSRVGIVSKRLDESSCILAWRFPSPYPTPCYKKSNLGISKIRALYVRNFVPSSGLKNFVAAKSRSCCQQNSSTVELVDDTYDGRHVVAVYYTSANCSSLITPLLRVAVDLFL